MASHDVPLEIASMLQSASINRHPSPTHDMNPSTAASERRPVRLNSYSDREADSDVDEDEIPISLLNPVPRNAAMPPLPDMRFEQSYLKSIEDAQSWPGVAWITLRDQVIMCFLQGVVWNVMVFGWRHFNRETKFSGRSVGAKLRRWWWGVNDWKIPAGGRAAGQKMAKNMTGNYKNQFSTNNS